ncbi:hypothetical protein [Candidatus Reidiella endopervernicosa]|uniref:Uncharacterized protein n=1 Tax=Candidatus Reidiella endopervernicosa TaxID=2738883 RepID=A0A6N0HT28_9GAMM|nr:hypothetical protein [Candidatus Reidiella endopervernicosa]QKQ25565.1 hypothetical protein HUE57_04050 [Candidatus Reidiella endopervernicosa]
MALLWYRKEGESRYEVRSAGATRRLYTNGVFHSQYNPNRPISGSVWGLLMLPALYYPPWLDKTGAAARCRWRFGDSFTSPLPATGICGWR